MELPMAICTELTWVGVYYNLEDKIGKRPPLSLGYLRVDVRPCMVQRAVSMAKKKDIMRRDSLMVRKSSGSSRSAMAGLRKMRNAPAPRSPGPDLVRLKVQPVHLTLKQFARPVGGVYAQVRRCLIGGPDGCPPMPAKAGAGWAKAAALPTEKRCSAVDCRASKRPLETCAGRLGVAHRD
jgi:hypothetical protein